jgi:F-type H+-transporting ATPase subunit delta
MANSQSSEQFDSAQQQLGQTYAKALLGVTEKAGTTSAVLAELDSFVQDVIGKLPEFVAVMGTARVSFEEREAILDRTLAGRMNPQLLNFLKVVVRHNRVDCLRAINFAAHRQYDEICGRSRVLVTSASELSAETQSVIQTRLSAALKKEVILSRRVDPAMMGGLLIQIGDKVFDSSVQQQLSSLQEEILAGARQRLRQDTDRFIKAV